MSMHESQKLKSKISVPSVGILFIDGFEEIEAVTIADVLRRANFTVDLIGVNSRQVMGSHQISIMTDELLQNILIEKYDAIVLPGGMPGSENLSENEEVINLLQHFNQQNKIIGAICAAPLALNSAGILVGRKITSHPSIAHQLYNSTYTNDTVSVDDNIVTGKGAGTALDFSLKLVAVLGYPNIAVNLAKNMCYSYFG